MKERITKGNRSVQNMKKQQLLSLIGSSTDGIQKQHDEAKRLAAEIQIQHDEAD